MKVVKPRTPIRVHTEPVPGEKTGFSSSSLSAVGFYIFDSRTKTGKSGEESFSVRKSNIRSRSDNSKSRKVLTVLKKRKHKHAIKKSSAKEEEHTYYYYTHTTSYRSRVLLK